MKKLKIKDSFGKIIINEPKQISDLAWEGYNTTLPCNANKPEFVIRFILHGHEDSALINICINFYSRKKGEKTIKKIIKYATKDK